YQQLQQLQATNMTTTLTTATRTRYQQLSQQRTELQHALASARQQLSQQPVDTQSQGLVGFYVQHQDQFDQLEAQLPTLQQTLGQYQTLTQQGSAAKADFQAQSNAHPELLGCLSPHKQAAIETLKATLAATANTRRQYPAPNSPSLDWRLIGGAIGIVAGLLLPLGGFKWILMLAGVALLGWFGMTRSQGKPVQATDPAKQRYPEYETLQNRLLDLQAQRTSTQRDLTKLDHEQQQLANLRNQWPVYQQLQQLQATNMTTTLTTATRTRYQQLSQQRTELQHALASARQQLSQQPVDTQSQGLVGFYVQHQDQFDQLEAQLPTLQQTLGQYQTLTQQ
ncbi:membrane protein, partial [Lactiplantibacillus plantarum]